MKQYTFTYLRDYFSARGLMLTRSHPKGYTLSNGRRIEFYGNMREVNTRARCGDTNED